MPLFPNKLTSQPVTLPGASNQTRGRRDPIFAPASRSGATLAAGGQGTPGTPTIDYSLDSGATWTHSPTDPFVGGSVQGMQATGGKWVALGFGPTQLAQSSDGISWTAQAENFAGGRLFDILHDSGLWLASGNSSTTPGSAGRILESSPDFTTWTTLTTPLDFIAQGIQKTLVHAAGLWVAGCQRINGTDGPVILTSPDAVTWTARTSPIDPFGHQNAGTSIAYGAGLFVGTFNIGGTFSIITSPDAITWTARSTPFDSSGAVQIVWNGSMFVALGVNGAQSAMRSTDGINWTATSLSVNLVGGLAWARIPALWVVTDFSGNVWTSPDAVTWTHVGTITNIDFFAVIGAP